jgi:TonB family protein
MVGPIIMFEDSFTSPKPERPPSRDRLAGILVTVLFHTLLGLIVYYGRVTVKIFSSPQEEVRNVVLVPPLRVAIPKIVGGRGLAELPGGTPGAPGPRRPAGAAEEARQGGEAGAAEPAGGGEPAPPGEPGPGWLSPPPGSGSATPSLSSKFRESLMVHGKSSLTIPLAPPGTPPGPPGVAGGAPLPDFSRYDRGTYGGGASGYGRGRGGRGSGGGGGGGGQRVGMSVALKGYDLLPWASKVIDRLQLNWMLPAAPEVPEGAKIGVIIVIKKTGELDSIEIVEGTSIEALDRAALDALRASLPFPPLPADFPGDLLEITFEFVYND